jgi:hypothetical protein
MFTFLLSLSLLIAQQSREITPPQLRLKYEFENSTFAVTLD